MAGTVDFIVVLCTVLMSVCHGEPVNYSIEPPNNLTVRWIDPLTVNVSWYWQRPKALHNNCTIQFEFSLDGKEMMRTEQTHFLEILLTDQTDHWVFSICTVCMGLKGPAANIIIRAQKPRANVEKFKCYIIKSGMNCFWISNEYSPISISYRECGTTPELLKRSFSECKNISMSVCHIKGSDLLQKELCIVADTASGRRTFRPIYALTPPKMKISEEGAYLILTLESLEKMPCLVYNICYSECNNPEKCQEHKMGESLKIPYARSCKYRFQSRTQTTVYYLQMSSDWSEILYGSTDWTLTVVAIVIPLIVSACVLLSFYCFRRHKDIICPEIPDPSTIFKEMINGNKETKTQMPVYTPVQEHVVHNITVLDIPQNVRHVPT